MISIPADLLAPKTVTLHTTGPLDPPWLRTMKDLMARAVARDLDAEIMGMKVSADPTLPPGTIEMRSGAQIVRRDANGRIMVAKVMA